MENEEKNINKILDKLIKFEDRNADNKHAQAKHSQDVWIVYGAANKNIYGNTT